MNADQLKTTVYARLEAIANAEKITRAELSALSRELLEYVPNTDDIDIVNRLLGVLTPMNKTLARMYFGHFLPWKQEKDSEGNFVRFGGRMEGNRKVASRMDKITEWLADETNNIWVWGDDNIEIKQKDLGGDVTKAVQKALKGHEKSDTPPLSPAEVVNAVFTGGITVDDLMSAIAARVEQAEADAQAEEQPEVAEAA